MLKLHRALGTYQKINYIFLTEFNKEKFKDLIDINGSNVFIKPNFVDEKKTPVERRGKIKFIFAGRLEEKKGINLLLERWKALPADYHLHIYGDGNLKEEVEKAVEETNNIEFYGFQPQSEIFRDLESSHGLIFPSIWYEGFPMIIAESFALGVPVLTTNIGNQADVIRQSQGGEVFEPNSEQSFISAVEKMVSEHKKLSLNAKSYYNATLNKDSNYALLEDIYTSSEIRGGGYSEVDEKKVFVFAGRLEQNKGILSLIEMWSSLPENYELHIYGEGLLEKKVTEIANRHQNIHYFGFKDRETIAQDQHRSVATIVSSECYETFGMAIPESFSKGLPVIATDIGSPGQMVKASGGGMIYRIRDINSFKNAIQTVITDHEICSVNAYMYYKNFFTADENYKRLIDIYDNARQAR
jgi:glycosyltransferase involved in cell wall biosynthesis